jgi:hypothetical protein
LRKPGVAAPRLIDEINYPISTMAGGQCWNRVDSGPQFLLGYADSFLRALAFRNVTQETDE